MDFDKQLSLYPWIIAWGHITGSYAHYIDAQVDKALKTDAPFDAIYQRDDGTWATLRECKNEGAIHRMTQYLAHAWGRQGAENDT